MPKVVIHISEEGNSEAVPCWIAIRNEAGDCIRDAGTQNIPGFPCDGDVAIDLQPGAYRVQIHQGPKCHWVDEKITITPSSDIQRFSFALKPYAGLCENGWFCGEIHDHPHGLSPRELAAYCAARGIDYISVCQGWLVPATSYLGHDGAMLAKTLESASTPRVTMRFGAEYPKTRLGHVSWFHCPVLQDPHGLHGDFHDLPYYDNQHKCCEPLTHPSDKYPFTNECNFNKIIRLKRRGGVNMAPHPTSWWLDNQTQRIITTNISADFVLGLFAGKLYDTLCVMGYDAEHIFYQNLWFELLNRGHKIAGVAETDGDTRSKHSIGHLRCYTHSGSKRFELSSYLEAVKAGRTFVTSGPVLLVTSEKGNLPGSSLTLGEEHVLEVEAFCDPRPDEYLTWLVLYRNGDVAEIADLESSRPRHVKHRFVLKPETERAWYVVKVYGSTRPQRREFADIRRYAAMCRSESHTEYGGIKQVAFTNPFYVEPPGYAEPAEIRPQIRGRVIDAKTKLPVSGARIEELFGGELQQTVFSADDGTFRLRMRIASELSLSAPNHLPTVVNIPVHCPGIQRIMDEIIAGRWALDGDSRLKPGQMPFEVFQYERTRETLMNGLEWQIALAPR